MIYAVRIRPLQDKRAQGIRPVINHHLMVASRVTFAVVSVRQELDSFPIDELVLRAPEIRRVDGSVQSQSIICQCKA